MSGTKEGGIKAKKTIIKRYGMTYYVDIGRKGGSVCEIKKGFAANPKLAREVGAIGGHISKRVKVKHE